MSLPKTEAQITLDSACGAILHSNLRDGNEAAVSFGTIACAELGDREPATPLAGLGGMSAHADAHLRALLRYTESFYSTAVQHGMRASPTANAIAHVERAGKALHQIVHAQEKMLEVASRASPQKVAHGDDFLQGVCVALQTIKLRCGVSWKEIVESVSADEMLNYAAFVEPEECELAGFEELAEQMLGRTKPVQTPHAVHRRHQSNQTKAEPQPISRGEWIAEARSVYMEAGDDPATALDCARYLCNQQDWVGEEIEEPRIATQDDIQERPRPPLQSRSPGQDRRSFESAVRAVWNEDYECPMGRDMEYLHPAVKFAWHVTRSLLSVDTKAQRDCNFMTQQDTPSDFDVPL